MTIGKIWYEAERAIERGRGRRAGTTSSSTRRRPATACSTCACRRRRATRSRSGWCTARRERVVDLLRDPARDRRATWSRTAEEMPVNETHRRCTARCATSCGMPTGLLFVNRVHEHRRRWPTAPTRERARARAPRRARDRRIGAAARRRRGARARGDRLGGDQRAPPRAPGGARSTLPIVELPFLFAEEFGFAELRALLASSSTRPAAPRARARGGGRGVKTDAPSVVRATASSSAPAAAASARRRPPRRIALLRRHAGARARSC